MGDLSAEQEECFKQFKEWINVNDVINNPWCTIDESLLRFCRARKFDLDKVIEMFNNYIKYREDNGLDDICHVSKISTLEKYT